MSTSEFSGPKRVAAENGALQMPAGFGRYELTKLLAVGGMAEVFLARGRSGGIERGCVIKRVLPRYSTNRQFVSMFIDEARITIGLDHENIVRLYDFGQVEGAYYMALEYVEGCDLVDILRAQKARGEGIPPAAAAYIARSVLRGLHHAHAQHDAGGRQLGIVHRDVSPQNIFVGWDGAVKIGDFGIADAKNKLTRTVHGTVKGKFSYMSPEQATGALLDGRSDVWAMGVVLWEMLVGGRLFAGDNPVDTMSRVMEAPIIRPSEMRSSVPPELDRIVGRALTRTLSDRYQSAAEMADDLEAFAMAQPCGPDTLGAFLALLDLQASTTEIRLRGGQGPRMQEGATVALPDDAELRRLHLELRKEKNLWTLVDISERHAELGEAAESVAAARTAAAIFAHRGLLVPAICALHSVRPLLDPHDVDRFLERLASLRAHDRAELLAVIKDVDRPGFFQHVQDADPEGLGAEHTDETLVHHPAPLFGKVTRADFVRLASVAVIEERSAGDLIVEEGDRGDCLYAVGRGRVLVHCKSVDDEHRNDRVYVAALAEGDFFGEFSLLTKSPRSATVEAASDLVLLRLDREALDGLVLGDASFREPLVDFYKERVAELLLARNPLVSALQPDARRRLLVKSSVHRYTDEQVIVSEGERCENGSDAVFFVMGGEVEVYHVEDGFPVFLDKLREGQIFGEMAALRTGTRSASVRAIGDVELLAVDGQALADVLRDAPDVKVLFERAMTARAQDARERIDETTRIFTGV
ncbi:MAG TPA: serine/threonine-protein kinase [Myxococcota bacterium]